MPAPDAKFRILTVDDSEDILALLEAVLGKEYDVRSAMDARTALKFAFEKPRPDLILLDVDMPGTSGYDLCRAIKASPALADIPVIFLTQRDDARDVVQGFQLGAIDYFTKPINPPVLAARIRAHVELITRRGAQDDLIRVRTTQLEQTRLQLIRRLGRAMEYHETSAVGNRVVRLGHYARTLAEASGAKPGLCDLIMKAAPLHDIGKLGVPAQILRKAEKLSAPERVQMQRHPEIGAEIIGEHDDPLLKLARTLALTHHERWDGNGYPSGIAGDDIPWPGRVMALVDAFEGMTATQFHREPMRLELAADEITRGSGKQFDPRIVEAFRKCLPAFRKIKETYADSLGDMLDLDFSGSTPPPAAPVAPVAAQADASDTLALQRMRESDEARAGVLAVEQARLKIERALLAAATKDISTQQASRKRAEAAAARETEAMVLARRRIAEEAAAAQAAQERAKAETDAALLAQQAEREKAQALAASEARLAAEQALAAAAEGRKKAEAALAATAATLASLDTAALETAGRRLEDEREATRLAIARAKAEADAAGIAKNAAQANAQRLAEAQMRVEAEQLLAEAAKERQEAEAAAAQSAEALVDLQARIRADREAGAASARKAAEERSATALARERAEREAEALMAARERLAEDEAAISAANERAKVEAQAARLATEAAQAAAKLIDSAEARARAGQSLAEAVQLRQGAEAEARVVASPPASKTREPRSRRRAFIYAVAVAALAAAAALYESEAPLAPVALPGPLPVLSDGEPLGLRLEVDVDRIVPRQRSN